LNFISEPGTDVRGQMVSRRVLATVLFTDIVGSTERARDLGDKAWRELLQAHDATVRREIFRFSRQ
jgi:class 3 adenylate cyclase